MFLLILPIFSIAQHLKPFKSESGLWGYKDSEGNIVIQPGFKDAKEFSEGLAAVLDAKKEKWTFINSAGNYIFEPRYKYPPRPFNDGFSIVVGDYTKSSFYYGVINTTGNTIVPAKYSKITGPCNGVFLLINENEKKYDISDDTYGFASTTGKIISEPVFSEASPCADEDGWIPVRLNGKKKYQHIDGRLSDWPQRSKYSGIPIKDYLLLPQSIVNLVTGLTVNVSGTPVFVNDYLIALEGDTLVYPTPDGYTYLKTPEGAYLFAEHEKNKKPLIWGMPQYYLASTRGPQWQEWKYYMVGPDKSILKLSDQYLQRSTAGSKYFSVLYGSGKENRDSVYYVILNNKGFVLGNSIKDYDLIFKDSILVYSINDSIFYYDGINHRKIAAYASALPDGLYSSAIRFDKITELPVKLSKDKIEFINKTTRQVTLTNIEGSKALPFINGKAPVLRNGLWGAINRNNEIVVPFEYAKITEYTKYNMLMICNNKDCYDFLKLPEKPKSPDDIVTIYLKYTFFGQKYSSVDPVFFVSVTTRQKYIDNMAVQKYVDEQAFKWLTTVGTNWYMDYHKKVPGDPVNFQDVWNRKLVQKLSENQWTQFRDLVKEQPNLGSAAVLTYL
jgi:hypothetical protein